MNKDAIIAYKYYVNNNYTIKDIRVSENVFNRTYTNKNNNKSVEVKIFIYKKLMSYKYKTNGFRTFDSSLIFDIRGEANYILSLLKETF